MSILCWKDVVLTAEPIMNSGQIQIKLATTTTTAACCVCGHFASSVHSHYTRTLSDLPWATNILTIELCVKRFRCQNEKCARKIFSQPIGWAPAYARRTSHMAKGLAHIGFSGGGKGEPLWQIYLECLSVIPPLPELYPGLGKALLIFLKC